MAGPEIPGLGYNDVQMPALALRLAPVRDRERESERVHGSKCIWASLVGM